MTDNTAPRAARLPWLLLAVSLLPPLIAGLIWIRPGDATQWDDIVELARRGQYAEAEAALVRWVKTHPRDGNAWELLAHVRMDLDRPAEAIEALRRVPETAPVWPHAQVELGKLLVKAKDLPGAEAVLRAALARDPGSIEALQQLLPVLVLERRLGEAREVLRRLYRRTRDPRPLADSMLLHQIESDVRDLGEDLADYIARTPNDPWVGRAWGLLLLARGRTAEARPYLEAAAEAFENDPLGRFALAECRMALGEAGHGIEVIGEPPARPVDAARWWVLRSRLEETWGDPAAARASLEQAVAADPRNVEALYRLGQAMVRAGDHAGGRERIERADRIATQHDALRRELRRVVRGNADRGAPLRIATLCAELGLPEVHDWLDLATQIDPRGAAGLRERVTPDAAGDSGPGIALSNPVLRRRSRVLADRAATPRPEPVAQPIRFEDVAEAAGLRFRYECGQTPDLFIADTMGGGVGLIDYDGDGWLDVYFVNGCALPVRGDPPPAPNKLFRNRGDGSFEDVTESAGVAGRGYGMGCAVADYDGDGDDDLFVTGLSGTILYRNEGNGTFTDVTEAAGVSSRRWTTAAGFADLDGDADLDLMVVTYVEADASAFLPCRDRSGRLIHCQPERFDAQFDQLFRNNGDGTFTDVSREAGLEQAIEGRGLGLAILDYDEDGRLDLFVANDGTANHLFRNLGGLRFEEVAMAAGAAYDAAGQPTASMGVAAQDLNGDGRLDLLHTNFLNQSCTLRLGAGGGLFLDGTLALGLAVPTRSKTGWGVIPLDADADGWLDLFMANGHVDDQPWFNTPMAQEPLLFRGLEGRRFEPLGPSAGAYFQRAVVGRGAASGDLDGDGRVDLVVVHRDAPVALLRNVTPGGRWLSLRLRGVESGGLPVGARVICQTGQQVQVRWVSSGTSYLSASDPAVHFGLGEAVSVDRLEVRWPSGRVQEWRSVPTNRRLELREGGEPVPIESRR
ncbi:MAG: hypothetical protein KatS3mg108_2245 [Isosphaeraceae bacterium]|jgi:tetratricopeptide (TPR) repeat protein|nr:MAG: hypothetical protein KatS3mg108_2245 [Isosphaeraceae bacterium]